MGLFGNLKNAPMFEKGQPLRCKRATTPDGKVIEPPQFSPERFVVQITKVIQKQTQGKGPAFIVEFTILESTNLVENPIGSTASWYQSLQDQNVAMPALKEFFGTVHGYNLKDPGHKASFQKDFEPGIEAYADAAVDESRNPLKGKKIGVECIMVKTKKNSDFTRHNWFPVTG